MSSFPRRNATRDARLKKKGTDSAKKQKRGSSAPRVVGSSPFCRRLKPADSRAPMTFGRFEAPRRVTAGTASVVLRACAMEKESRERERRGRAVSETSAASARLFFFFARPSRQIEERAKKGRAPCVRPHARAPMPKRRDTPAQKIVLEQVFFTNRSLEASWVNSVRSSQRRVVVSVAFRRARSRTKREIQVSRTSRHARARSIRRWGARRRRRVASPPSPPAARAPPPPPCGQK